MVRAVAAHRRRSDRSGVWLSAGVTGAVFVPLVIYLGRPQCNAEPEPFAADTGADAEATAGADDGAVEESAPHKQRAPGSQIVVELPEAFVPASEIGGFIRPGTLSSVTVSSAQVPYDPKDMGEVQPEDIEAAGLRDFELKAVTHHGRDAWWGEGRQTAPDGRSVAKFMLSFGDESTTVTVAGTAEPSDEGLVRRAVRTAVLDPEAAAALEGELVFSVDDVEGLVRVAEPFSGNVAFTPTGQLGGDPGEAFLLVGPSNAATELTDPMAFARARLLLLPGFEEAKIVTEDPAVIGDLRAVRITALARRDGEKIAGVLTLVPTGPSGYLLAFGRVAMKDRAQYFPLFDRIVDSLRPK